MAEAAEIPYGGYWSTPFAKWQGSLQHLHSVEFAARVAEAALSGRDIPSDTFDYGVLGITVPQHRSFYGASWLFGMLGAGGFAGPTISQACATGARSLLAATQELTDGGATAALVITCDRTSNGPHVYYPAPRGPGGTGVHEDWVLDNFSCDPSGNHSMLQTAENVARRHDISTSEQHDVVLRRYEQYTDALADDHAFQKRYMELPFEVPKPNFRGTAATLEGDEGVFETSREKMDSLRPVLEGGTVTFAGQTHPADGNASVIVATPARAREISLDRNIRIRLLGFGSARTELGFMPEATVPAAKKALDAAGVTVDQLKAIKSHNPFAVNDIYFSRTLGVDVDKMNNYGSSLIWGHPQAPTGMRSIIELIEELVSIGGGSGLFTGCAAGDTAMAIVVKVDERPTD